MAAMLISAQAVDYDGAVLSGAKLNVYDAGTTTPRAIYASKDLASGASSANPAVATATGGIAVWVDDSAGDIKVTLTNSAGTTTYYSQDDIDPTNGNLVIFPLGGSDQTTGTGDSVVFADLTVGAVAFSGVTTDPGADRIMFWDDSDTQVEWLSLGTGLSITGNALSLDGDLEDISGLTPADGAVIIGDGTDFTTESGSTLRASLGVAVGSDVLAYDANLQAFVEAFTAPTTDGTAGQYLKTDGSGGLSFATPSGGGDTLAAANETIAGDWTFTGSPTMSGDLKYTATGGSALRAAQDRAADVVSVKDFGATGDGVTNDRAAFVSAVTAAAGGLIRVPAGTYAITTSVTLSGNFAFDRGAKVLPASAQTIAFTGSVYAEPDQHILDVSSGGAFTFTQARLAAKWFGALGDGSTDDYIPLSKALASMPSGASQLYFVKGDYRVSASLGLTKTGQQLIGDHPQFVQIKSTAAALPVLTIADGIGRNVLRGLEFSHSVTATSGGDGVQTNGSVGRCTIEGVWFMSNYNGFVGTSTDYSVIRDCIASGNVNDGFVLKNDADDIQVQWNFRGRTLSQNNGRDGYRVESVTGGSAAQITLGTWQNIDTANNDGYGVRILGASSVPIQDIRMYGCFIGADGTATMYLDTYGKQHQITNSFFELSSSDGVIVTANNSDLIISGCIVSACQGYGITADCDHVTVSGCTFVDNGVDAGLTDKQRSAIRLAGQNCVVSCSVGYNTGAGTSQKYGVHLENTGNTVIACDFAGCAVDDVVFTAPGTFAGTTLCGNTDLNGKSVSNLGIVYAAGTTAAAVPYAMNGEAGTGMFSPSAGVVAWARAGTESARLTASGALIVGATSGPGKISGIASAGGTSLYLTDGTYSTLSVKHEAGNLLTWETAGAAKQRWVLNSAEAMRIDGGNLLLGKTSGSYKVDVAGDVNVDTGQAYRVNGVIAIGGVGAAIADPNAITAYTAPVISATYVQSESQAIADALATLRAEVEDLRAKLQSVIDAARAKTPSIAT
jgi:hypothetical protein